MQQFAKTARERALLLLLEGARPYRRACVAALERLHLKRTVLASDSVRRMLSGEDDPTYKAILDSRPHSVNRDSAVELHVLVCERDFLRCVWALKSFFHFSGLDPRLVIHDDGTLSTASRRALNEHFVGCRLLSNATEFCLEALASYPRCSLFRRTHVISQKLLDVLVFAEGHYVIVMDSDVLWYSPSSEIQSCVDTGRPFYLEGGLEAYVRNRRFMEVECGLRPASNVNSGIVGFRAADFNDLAFLETCLEKLINVPPHLLAGSLGYRHHGPLPGYDEADALGSIVWWVMEQTLYALLLGRGEDPPPLALNHADGGVRHVFIGHPLDAHVALQHFISDTRWNGFFPVGVHRLLLTDFLAHWNQRAPG